MVPMIAVEMGGSPSRIMNVAASVKQVRLTSLNDLEWNDVLQVDTDLYLLQVTAQFPQQGSIGGDGDLLIAVIPADTAIKGTPVTEFDLIARGIGAGVDYARFLLTFDAISPISPLYIPRGFKIAARWHSAAALNSVTVTATYIL